jgi:uncharacterized glyoxalase superfamily protein PhnB
VAINSVGPAGSTQRAQPESFRARVLGASLTVKDVNASVAWYRDVLGCVVNQRHERDGKVMAVSMKAGDVRFLLAQDDGAKGMNRVKGEGISLQFTTAQDVDEVAKRIKASGGTLATEPTDMHGVRAFRLHDPDGFKLVISSERDG